MGAVSASPGADVRVFPSADALVAGASDAIVAAAADAVRASGRFTLALAGGSTPRRLYERLARVPEIDWGRVELGFGDERCVPPDDSASNYRMAREALLARVPIPPAGVHRMRGEDVPAVAAAAYERELRALFATPTGPPRGAPGATFDLVLLGMGANGHTASLFPGLPAVREAERWAVASYVEEVDAWRLTLTPIVLNAAFEVIFLVDGREKAAMLRRVLREPYAPDVLPAQAIQPTHGRLRWLVDAEAASAL
jgi:6-phosphogluconolactonase